MPLVMDLQATGVSNVKHRGNTGETAEVLQNSGESVGDCGSFPLILLSNLGSGTPFHWMPGTF